jgi:hypothetical protein
MVAYHEPNPFYVQAIYLASCWQDISNSACVPVAFGVAREID